MEAVDVAAAAAAVEGGGGVVVAVGDGPWSVESCSYRSCPLTGDRPSLTRSNSNWLPTDDDYTETLSINK